jgi:hypothetical protein
VSTQADIDTIMGNVEAELHRATRRFGPLASPHEGIAVIREEYMELEREVYWGDGRGEAALAEAVQLAAMACRYLLDIGART